MRKTPIPDQEIPDADPAALMEQYAAWIQKIANQYAALVEESGAYDMEDLLQAAALGLLEAQKTYNPEKGCTFLSWSYAPIRYAMLELLGYRDKNRTIPPAALIPLDAKISEDSEDTLLDSIPDLSRPFDECICEKEAQEETAAEVRAAVARMKSDRQREVIRRVYLEEQKREQAAAEMGITTKAVYALDRDGRSCLRKDRELRNYVMPFFTVGLQRFQSSWTSSVEMAVFWREEHLHSAPAISPLIE